MDRYAELVPVVLPDGWYGYMPRCEIVGAWAWCPCGGEYLECESCEVAGCAECCEYMLVCSRARMVVCSDCAWSCLCCGDGVPLVEAESIKDRTSFGTRGRG